MKPLASIHLRHPEEHVTTRWSAGIGARSAPVEDAAFEDLFKPQWWVHHAAKLNIGDLVRIRAADGSFDVAVTVTAKVPGGLKVELWPNIPSAGGDLAAQAQAGKAVADASRKVGIKRKVAGKPVPRVEFQKASGWRVLGHDGNEVSRNHRSEAEAEDALAAYLSVQGVERFEDA